ncbi:MAG: tetratricopeptide repeat protein [Bacteroidaceae bacterium]|nr:tetratricopeptide repeat protein [Bacteroidaceae bacterium]
MMKRILYIAMLLLLPLAATAGNDAKENGDKAYEEKRYSDAIAIYEEAIKGGNESKQLYYNLGNAYFRNNETGRAILNYERALRLDPADEDVKANLEFANKLTKDEVAEEYEIFLVTWWKAFVNMLSTDTWAIVAVMAFAVSLAGLVMMFLSKNSTVRNSGITASAVCFVICIIANFAAYSSYSRMTDNSKAIVLKEEVSVMSAPGASAVLTKVHEGRKLNATDETTGRWTKIELEDGTVGWVMNSDIERI